MAASRGAGLRRRQQGVDADLLDGIERNRRAHKIELRLINDIGGIDAVIGIVVIVAAPAGVAD